MRRGICDPLSRYISQRTNFFTCPTPTTILMISCDRLYRFRDQRCKNWLEFACAFDFGGNRGEGAKNFVFSGFWYHGGSRIAVVSIWRRREGRGEERRREVGRYQGVGEATVELESRMGTCACPSGFVKHRWGFLFLFEVLVMAPRYF